MSKTAEEIRQALRENEERINKHLEGLRQEVTGGKGALREVLSDKPLVGVGGALLIGVITGLILGKKPKKSAQDTWLDDQMENIGQLAREVGASPETLSLLLKDALQETRKKSSTKTSSRGILGLLMGLASDVALGFAKNSLLSYLQNTLVSSQVGMTEEQDNHSKSME